MATTKITELEPLLLLPDCPRPRILQALRLAFRAFCNDTHVWQEQLPEMTTVADQSDYSLTSDYSDAEIHRVPSVKVAGVSLLDSQWSVSRDNTLTLDPAPSQDGKSIIVEVVYLPLTTCTAVVDWLVTTYAETVAAKAESKLRADPVNVNNPVSWYDPDTAAYKERQYREGVSDAKASDIINRQSGETAVPLMEFYL